MLRVKKKTANWNQTTSFSNLCQHFQNPKIPWMSKCVQTSDPFWQRYKVVFQAPEMVVFDRGGSANVQSLASKLTSAPGRAADITGVYSNRSNTTESMVIRYDYGKDRSIQVSPHMDCLSPGFGPHPYIILKSLPLKPVFFWNCEVDSHQQKNTTKRSVCLDVGSNGQVASLATNSKPPLKSSADFCTLRHRIDVVTGFGAFSGQWLFWTILPGSETETKCQQEIKHLASVRCRADNIGRRAFQGHVLL